MYQHVANQDTIACSVGLCRFRSLFCVASYKSRSLGDSFSEPLLAWRSEGWRARDFWCPYYYHYVFRMFPSFLHSFAAFDLLYHFSIRLKNTKEGYRMLKNKRMEWQHVLVYLDFISNHFGPCFLSTICVWRYQARTLSHIMPSGQRLLISRLGLPKRVGQVSIVRWIGFQWVSYGVHTLWWRTLCK